MLHKREFALARELPIANGDIRQVQITSGQLHHRGGHESKHGSQSLRGVLQDCLQNPHGAYHSYFRAVKLSLRA